MKPTDTPWTAIALWLCYMGTLGMLACMCCGKALWWGIHPVVAFVINAVFLVIALVGILTLILLRWPCRHYGWDIDRDCWIKERT